jgi:hypothetical protein
MVREFAYRGEIFRATVHGRTGKEEIFLIHMVDGEEGPEISIDRFEDADNDPNEGLEQGLIRLADKLFSEQGIVPSDADAPFAWIEAQPRAQVHSGVQAHDHL